MTMNREPLPNRRLVVNIPNDWYEDDEVTQFVVISAADNRVHGPFFTRATAYAHAEAADGTVFVCMEDDGAGRSS
jgi:hypothetical protein